MSTSFHDLLRSASDFDLCNGVFLLIVDQFDTPIGDRPEPARTVSLVWHSMGIIGNGGFHYLFEDSFQGDPGFLRTVASYQKIGAGPAYSAFIKAFDLFPGGVPPPEIERRLEIYESNEKDVIDGIDSRFFAAVDDVESCLAQFIRTNAPEFERLLDFGT